MNDDRTTYIDFFGQQYPLCLTVLASQKITERFGGIEALGKALEAGGADGLTTWAELLHILMEGGAGRVKAIAWLNGEDVATPSVPDLETITQILSWSDVSAFGSALWTAMGVSTQTTVETEPEKNAEATQGSN